jgi:hypothetical protein
MFPPPEDFLDADAEDMLMTASATNVPRVSNTFLFPQPEEFEEAIEHTETGLPGGNSLRFLSALADMEVDASVSGDVNFDVCPEGQGETNKDVLEQAANVSAQTGPSDLLMRLEDIADVLLDDPVVEEEKKPHQKRGLMGMDELDDLLRFSPEGGYKTGSFPLPDDLFPAGEYSDEADDEQDGDSDNELAGSQMPYVSDERMEYLRCKLNECRPIPPKVDEDEYTGEKELEVWMQFARLNGQTMEQLQLEGPPDNHLKVPPENPRHGTTYERALAAVAPKKKPENGGSGQPDELSWEKVKKTTIRREGGPVGNHLNSRFDFGGAENAAYRDLCRRLGSSLFMSPHVTPSPHLTSLRPRCSGHKQEASE